MNKLTLNDIFIAQEALKVLFTSPIPSRKGYELRKITPLVNADLKIINDLRDDFIRRQGVEVDKDNFLIPNVQQAKKYGWTEENVINVMTDMSNQLTEVLSKELDYTFPEISIDEFLDATPKCSAETITMLTHNNKFVQDVS